MVFLHGDESGLQVLVEPVRGSDSAEEQKHQGSDPFDHFDHCLMIPFP